MSIVSHLTIFHLHRDIPLIEGAVAISQGTEQPKQSIEHVVEIMTLIKNI